MGLAALQDTPSARFREIRTYYDFPGIDIDRYQICVRPPDDAPHAN